MGVRWSGLVLAAGLFAASLWQEGLVALLVALEQVLAWRLRVPLPWEIAASVVSVVAAVSSYFDLYVRLWRWDLAVHAPLTGLLAVVLAWGLRRPRPVVIILGGLALAIAWELLELWGHVFIDRSVNVAPLDTAGDVLAGVCGAGVAALLWTRGVGTARGTCEVGHSPREMR